MPAAVLITALLLLASAPACSAPGEEVSISEFMKRIPAMLESGPPPIPINEATITEIEDDDEETHYFISSAMRRPPRPVYLGGDGRLKLYRPETGEAISVAYRRRDYTYNPSEVEKVNSLMRCRLTKKTASVSLKLLEILDAVEDHFGGDGLTLLSGYRTPVHNKRIAGSARRSLHMLGWAADIRVPGRRTEEVADYAVKLGAGGVGLYPEAAFVHLDSGKNRNWSFSKKPAGTDPPRAPEPLPAR